MSHDAQLPVDDDVAAPPVSAAATRAEHALRVSEAKFSGIVSISSDAIISVDATQSIINFNRGAEIIFGYRAAEVLGKPLDMLIPERFRAAHRSHVHNFGLGSVAARRMGERAEIMGLRADGSEFPADASISKLDIDGERIYTAVLRDVTDRKQAERAQTFLAQAGTLLATSLDYATTIRSVVQLAVPTLGDWAVLYELDRDERPHRLELAHADADREPLLEELSRYPLSGMPGHPVFRVLETGEPVRLESVPDTLLDELASDAQQRALFEQLGMRSLMIVPLLTRGRALGALGFYSGTRSFDVDDLTLAQDLAMRAALAMDNARLYREAQDAVRARDDVLAVVSHDLGNPLSAIRIGASLLLKRRPAESRDESWQHLEAIRQSTEQMERLINDLLEVKRLEAGQLALDRRPQRPTALVAEAFDMFREIAAAREQTLVAHVEPDLPLVHADRRRALQVLSNVMGNALKFTPAGGRVDVTVAPAPDGVCFAVADTGPGIPEEHLAHIFDRFWQVTKQSNQGIGLGLAIAKGIIDAHGGRIWAESEPGHGARVSFTFPAAV